MGIPVRSQETLSYNGKGMSKGGPGIISNIPQTAASMLATASFLVSNFSKSVSPNNRIGCMLKHIYIFLKTICLFC